MLLFCLGLPKITDNEPDPDVIGFLWKKSNMGSVFTVRAMLARY